MYVLLPYVYRDASHGEGAVSAGPILAWLVGLKSLERGVRVFETSLINTTAKINMTVLIKGEGNPVTVAQVN